MSPDPSLEATGGVAERSVSGLPIGLSSSGELVYPPRSEISCPELRGSAAGRSAIGVPHGCSEKKDFAHEARPAPLRGRAFAPRLCRGQGFGRAPPAAPHRPEERDVSRAPSAQGQKFLTRIPTGIFRPRTQPAAWMPAVASFFAILTNSLRRQRANRGCNRLSREIRCFGGLLASHMRTPRTSHVFRRQLPALLLAEFGTFLPSI